MDENVLTPEESLVEELIEEPQDDSLSLSEAMEETATPETEAQGTGESEKAEPAEPGYVKRRISEAVNKALAEQQANFEAQMAPMREYMLNQEAAELVRSGKVKDLETAKELVRYRQGQPQPAPSTGQDSGQPRNEQGQFTRRQEGPDPVTQARINMLQHQANRIKASGGPDVIAEFRNNEDTRMKIVSGEMDFYDVAEQLRSKKRTAPMRSPNGASGADNKTAIEQMTDEQFARLVKNVQSGRRYSAK